MKEIIRKIIFYSAVFICSAMASHHPKQIDDTVLLFPTIEDGIVIYQ